MLFYLLCDILSLPRLKVDQDKAAVAVSVIRIDIKELIVRFAYTIKACRTALAAQVHVPEFFQRAQNKHIAVKIYDSLDVFRQKTV